MVYQKFLTKNAQETFQLGYRLGKKLNKKTILCLYGELGSGKTTFVQGLAAGLGIKKRIISPTFIFIRDYKITTKILGRLRLKRFYHIDLYRVKNKNDIETLGLGSFFKRKDIIIAIEWPEILRNFLPEKRTEVYFKYIDENRREIELIEKNSKLIE